MADKEYLILDDRLYTETDEWIKKIGNSKYHVGITDYAQYNIKDIYIIDLPHIGEELTQFKEWGEIEAEKATSELYSPINGKVTATNQDNFGEITDTEEPDPTITRYTGELFNINKKPYETWLIEIETDDESQLEKLLSPEDYKKYILNRDKE